MARRRRSYKRSSKCPEPINTLLDIAGAATLGLYVKHKVKKDFQNGCGEESAKAAAAVFGMGSMRGGSRGIIHFGGLVGLNSALKNIERQKYVVSTTDQPPVIPLIEKKQSIINPVKPGLWREYCEDGAPYGISPNDYSCADDYNDALINAKSKMAERNNSIAENAILPSDLHGVQTQRWRLYCEDGSTYGVHPEDYSSADDYNDALNAAKNNKTGSTEEPT